MDGDGRAEVVIGALGHDTPAGAQDAGRVFILSAKTMLGEPGGWSSSISGEQFTGQLGYRVRMVGDVNGDNLADVLLGERGYDGLFDNAGAAHLVLGSADGLPEAMAIEELDASFVGSSEYARVGVSMAGLGDVNGDGLADLAITGELKEMSGAYEVYREGAVYLVSGRETGWEVDTSVEEADGVLIGETTAGAAGLGIAGGDFDGDGYADVAVGAPRAMASQGEVFILPGGPEALSGEVLLSSAPVHLQGEFVDALYGWELAAGDVTGDGIADLIIGAPGSDRAYPMAGAAHVILGASDLMSQTAPTAAAVWTGEFDDHQLGTGLDAGKDVDGDGLGDLVVGAIYAYSGLRTKNGSTFLVPGSESGWSSEVTITEVATTFHGAWVKDYLGTAAALGDINGDGAADVVLGTGFVDGSAAVDAGASYVFWGGGL